MVDEIEAHLHPRWQRIILPELLKVSGILSSELEMQLMVATHSPLALASAEPVCDATIDKLFQLEATQSGKVVFEESPFVRYGLVDSWLTSDLFDLQQRHPVFINGHEPRIAGVDRIGNGEKIRPL